jgi:hypothetical protein
MAISNKITECWMKLALNAKARTPCCHIGVGGSSGGFSGGLTSWPFAAWTAKPVFTFTAAVHPDFF